MFVAVMEEGSFSAAASRMRVSSGQASKLIGRLEKTLGVQLLVRTTRALHPTEVGKAYFERVRHLLEEWEELDATVRSASDAPRGRLRMTVPITFGTRILSPLLCEFAAAHPAIGLDVAFSDRSASLVDEGFDLALRIGAPKDSGLIARRLARIRLVTAAAPDYLRQRGVPVTPAELSGHDCIIDMNFREPGVWRFRDPADQSAIAVGVAGRLSFANAEACAVAAEAGLGILHGPSFVSGPALAAGRLRRILPDCEPEPVDLMALYPAARHLAGKVRVLVDFLVSRFREDPPWDRDWT